MRIFFHLIDITCANSWILHKKLQQERNEKVMTFPDFKSELAEWLCLSGVSLIATRKSKSKVSSILQSSIDSKRMKKTAAHIPPKEVRTDQIGHFPIYESEKCRSRCKLINCDKLTNVKCTKCEVFLCFNASRNCFLTFHTI